MTTEEAAAKVAEFVKLAEKATPGPLRFSPMKGTQGHCHAAQIWSEDGRSLAVIDDWCGQEQASATAELFASSREISSDFAAIVSRALEFREDARAFANYIMAYHPDGKHDGSAAHLIGLCDAFARVLKPICEAWNKADPTVGEES